MHYRRTAFPLASSITQAAFAQGLAMAGPAIFVLFSLKVLNARGEAEVTSRYMLGVSFLSLAGVLAVGVPRVLQLLRARAASAQEINAATLAALIFARRFFVSIGLASAVGAGLLLLVDGATDANVLLVGYLLCLGTQAGAAVLRGLLEGSGRMGFTSLLRFAALSLLVSWPIFQSFVCRSCISIFILPLLSAGEYFLLLEIVRQAIPDRKSFTKSQHHVSVLWKQAIFAGAASLLTPIFVNADKWAASFFMHADERQVAYLFFSETAWRTLSVPTAILNAMVPKLLLYHRAISQRRRDQLILSAAAICGILSAALYAIVILKVGRFTGNSVSAMNAIPWGAFVVFIFGFSFASGFSYILASRQQWRRLLIIAALQVPIYLAAIVASAKEGYQALLIVLVARVSLDCALLAYATKQGSGE